MHAWVLSLYHALSLLVSGRKGLDKQASSRHSQQPRQAPAPSAVKGLPLSWLDIFVLSALAKIGATLVTYPLLVVKNRLQVWDRHKQEQGGVQLMAAEAQPVVALPFLALPVGSAGV